MWNVGQRMWNGCEKNEKHRKCERLRRRTLPAMPRRPRHQQNGASYHVVSRGNNKQVIFDDDLRRLFLRTVQSIADALDWRVLAFALMRNHYHLVLKMAR